jgi:hypothetical protein
MRMLVVFLLLGGIAACAEADGTRASHRYRGWVEDETLVIKEPPTGSTQGSLVIGDDAVYQADFCSQDSEYFCFTSQAYAFAVPKRLEPSVRRWTIGVLSFEIVREGMELSLLGSRISGLLLIKLRAGAKYGAEATDRDAFYLYSPKRGLVAFGFDPAYPYATTYWMESRVGFGAGDMDVAHRQ